MVDVNAFGVFYSLATTDLAVSSRPASFLDMEYIFLVCVITR